MMYNPRSTRALSNKYAIKSAESVDSFLESKTRSAKESIQDEVVEFRAQASLRSYVLSQVFSILSDAKLFFSKNPEQAYEELLQLMQSPEIRDKVIEELQKLQEQEEQLRNYYPTDAAWAERKAYERCVSANRSVKAAEAELDLARKWKDGEYKKARQAFPNIPLDEEEE